MSYSVISLPHVKEDLVQAVHYYHGISPALSRQFLFRLREAKSYILLSPLGFQVRYKEVRTLLLKQFPFHIHYVIDDPKKQIVIIAVIHAYKNPQDYTQRSS